MTARFTRRMSSSLFPLNMDPTITSSPEWAGDLIGLSYRLLAVSAVADAASDFTPYRLLKRSTRPWMSSMCCLPVKNGWHLAQTSTWSSGFVEPVVNVFPHAHFTVAWMYLGWIFSFMSCLCLC